MLQNSINLNFKIKCFTVKYKTELSPLTKIIIQNFKFKLYYYVLEDLLYLLKFNSVEQSELINILDFAVIFLQNNFAINYLDIYIYEINIIKVSKINKFINKSINFNPINYLNIKLAYRIKPILKILETN